MVKIVKNPGNGRLNNLNDPNRPQCVKHNGLEAHPPSCTMVTTLISPGADRPLLTDINAPHLISVPA